MDAYYFSHEGELHDWFRWQSLGQTEVWIGVYKKNSLVPSISIRQAMDAALCFGWSESKWKTVDLLRFCIRFTPRKPRRGWSKGTATRYLELEALGLVHDQGRVAWENRDVPATDFAMSQR